MKELFVQFSAYNLWANQQLLDAIVALPEEKHKQEVPSSFNTLFKTVLHMWNAENIWWQRIKLMERIITPGEQFSGNMKELADGLLKQDKLWNDWINNAGNHTLEHVFQYQNSKKEQFKQPVYQVLLHMFNHSTYHRGQLVTMMRELGVEKVPGTDFILWCRKFS